MRRRETILKLLATDKYGSLRSAAQAIGLSHETMNRANTGAKVSNGTRAILEREFELPLEELQAPFLPIFEDLVASL